MDRHLLVLVAFVLSSTAAWGQDPTPIGQRRELFVDAALIDRLVGGAEQRLHAPQPREVVLEHDAPWEGSGSGYHSVFHDGTRYRMYYKAWQLTVTPEKLDTAEHPLFCCYAESDDGIRWRKPELGLHDFQGSRANNIVISQEALGKTRPDGGHPAVFLDENADALPDARYKALVRSASPRGLLALKSADGLRWSPMVDEPVITDGAFDSQNLAFWDGERGVYRAYWRYFAAGVVDEEGNRSPGRRAIRTATSKDFIRWTDQRDLEYVDSPPEQLYTNQIKPYYRAPHILIGFPTRYVERSWSPSLRALPEREHRESRSRASQRYGTAITEALVMSSRDGVRFHRWNEAFLRPGIEREGTWNYGQQYLAWHVVETPSDLPGAPPELSLYASESYWTGKSSLVRRYTLRLDGFVSIWAPQRGGEVITKPIVFTGRRLSLNFSSSAAGGIQVEIQDAAGTPLPGYSLADSEPQYGDSLHRTVTWKSGSDVGALEGQGVRLRFVLSDADLYAFQFQAGQ